MRRNNDQYAKAGSPFAVEFQAWLDRDRWDRSRYKSPDEVAAAALHAMSSPEPLRRYMVVPNEAEAGVTIDKQIEELVQLNSWQAYAYSREELIARLDAVPAADSAIAELTTLLQDFLAHSSMADAHARFWADDLVYTSSNGTRFGKADIMQGFTDPDADDGDEQTVAYTGEDVNVQVFGTTAIVTFRLVGTPADGSASSEYFNTGTFLKRHGEWRAVAWQATMIPAGTGVNPDA
jgi:hypothetical protein